MNGNKNLAEQSKWRLRLLGWQNDSAAVTLISPVGIDSGIKELRLNGMMQNQFRKVLGHSFTLTAFRKINLYSFKWMIKGLFGNLVLIHN